MSAPSYLHDEHVPTAAEVLLADLRELVPWQIGIGTPHSSGEHPRGAGAHARAVKEECRTHEQLPDGLGQETGEGKGIAGIGGKVVRREGDDGDTEGPREVNIVHNLVDVGGNGCGNGEPRKLDDGMEHHELGDFGGST